MSSSFYNCEKRVQLDKHSFNYYHRIGTGDEAIVFLHGYPTSSLDFLDVWDLIPERYTLVAHDHLGFGKSDKPLDYDYLLIDQAEYALKLYSFLCMRKIHLVAHDYGTSVATEIIARDNINDLKVELQSITLSNGSMLIDMAKLRPIQRLLKNKITGSLVSSLSSRKIFHRNMKNIWYDESLYNKDAMESHWQLLVCGNGRRVLPQVTGYIDQRYANYDRWIGALEITELPIHVLWAQNDPVAVVAMADKLESIILNCTKCILYNCGHYPMIEKPIEWANKLLDFILKSESNLTREHK